jgi:ribosomal-protein-alanine N-acetyltransferase
MPVLLRSWQAADLDTLVAQADNINVWNQLRNYFPHPYTPEDGEAWIAQQQGIVPAVNLAIEADGFLAGGIGIIRNTDVYYYSAEIGYWLGETFWGKGIATEAVRQMVDYAFFYFDITRLYAEVFEYNKASMRVLEKNGFYLEGVRRKAVFKNGIFQDDYIWVKIRV